MERGSSSQASVALSVERQHERAERNGRAAEHDSCNDGPCGFTPCGSPVECSCRGGEDNNCKETEKITHLVPLRNGTGRVTNEWLVNATCWWGAQPINREPSHQPENEKHLSRDGRKIKTWPDREEWTSDIKLQWCQYGTRQQGKWCW